jgi:hypothetical protein
MSSMETPEGPETPEPSEGEVCAAIGTWLFWTGCLAAIALTVIGYGEATGRILFF